jgi:hypothetical protein
MIEEDGLRKLMLAATIAVLGLLPAALRAEEPPLLTQNSPPVASASAGRSQLMAIGVGLVVGAGLGSLFAFQGSAIIGAVAGGILGGWWYGDHSDIAPLTPRKNAF